MGAAKIFASVFLLLSVSIAHAADDAQIAYEIVRTLPHSTENFTQGLVMRNGRLFESTGRYGHSSLHELDTVTGAVLRTHALPNEIFAEGLTLLKGRLYQLSWQNRLGFIYDTAFKPIGSFRYPMEGWGLTDDGGQLILSDGSDTLFWMEFSEFQILRQLQVRYQNQPVSRLNELEYAKGRIFANVWLTPYVVVISPETGEVEAALDFSALLSRFEKPAGWNAAENVLNGIAYDAENDLFYITGKCWPLIFVIRLTEM